MTGRSVRLYLADGSPGGLLTAEIVNWTGHVVAAPRSDLAALLGRDEARRTGVYLLLGDDPDSLDEQLVYVGEGDDVGKRLKAHARPEFQQGKDFWGRAVVLTSKDSNLTKAHARYLESRLISIVAEAGRARLQNSTSPDPVMLPEADVSDMEYFIDQVRIVLPVLGVNVLRSTQMSAFAEAADDGVLLSPVFVFEVPKHGICAKAREVDGEFTLLADSIVRSSWEGAGHSYSKRHEQLIVDGVLELIHGTGTARVTRNVVVSSPSAGAAISAGRSANGRESWVTEATSQTYAVWQNSKLESDLEAATDE